MSLIDPSSLLPPCFGATKQVGNRPAHRCAAPHPVGLAGTIRVLGETAKMTYIVTDNCIKCKYTDCVEVCPVDCFYEGENMLVIHPDECIDCGVCEPECPAEAILPDTEPGLEKWLQINTEYADKWPNITVKKEQMPDAEKFDGAPGKYEKYFTENPGTGD